MLINKDFLKESVGTKAAPLPFSAARDRAGGRRASALFRLLALGLLLAPQARAGTPLTQIEAAVDQALAERVAAHAQRQSWQGLRFVRESGSLIGSAPAQACAEPLQVGGGQTGDAPLGRQRFSLHCPTQPGWTRDYLAQVELYLPVLFASQALERGQTLDAAQLKRQEAALSKLGRGFYHRAEEVIGLGAKRRIRADQLLTPALLGEALLVKRGQQVKIQASQDGISASTLGEALDNGQRGDVIRVRNLSSEKVIKAKVMDEGVVSSRYQ
ncbi:flagellar basal body P-ring formation protein FlgA [Pseudomonas sp. L-22-4S-12]|uniref:flagellar basal body P-ring formation chaperone FlgA n=1 Tax=Pseudomonas sp. L-22-4S-12 TaxID=2610893 RepID=UPI00132886A9|nr:flagellar basal body P-ring formation chaperone FlgA [Pseudomonas sp. L-22-4S-12]MWV17413.1 flagellar basal body P-ring formation protein FlgA [Pseudomonas sp. L-22-4S-12]